LAMQGAELFLYLTNAANPKERTYIWRSHLISRAAENQRFLVGTNVAHACQHCSTLIIAPNGEVLDEAEFGSTTLIRQKLDLSHNANWYLNQCRTDILAVRSTREKT
jgi:omega-amidase